MSEKKDVIFISISVGWAIRNFFQTGIINELTNKFRVIIITTNRFKKGIEELNLDSSIEFIVHNDEKEPFIWRMVRQVKKKLYLEYRGSSTEKIWKSYVKRPLYQRIGDKLIEILSDYFDLMKIFNWIDKNQHIILKTNKYNDVFNNYKPKFLFTTQISDYFDEYIIKNAEKCHISIVYMVMSWDHLSSKVVLSNYFHSIFVWNQITFHEIIETYSSYKPEQIKVVGIPQFDVYFDQPEISYKKWCNSLGLDSNRKTIYFTAAPFVRSEHQGVIVEEILKKINDEGKFSEKIQILFKCHPLDDLRKYKYLENYNYIKVVGSIPDGNFVTNNQWIPSKDELVFQRDCLYFCSININIFSTVTLEAAFFNKPIIHISYDPLPIVNRIPCHEYYNFEHFKPIQNIGAGSQVFSNKELIDVIQMYLSNPEIKSKERSTIVDKYWEISKYPSSKNIVSELEKLSNILKAF